MNKILFSLSLLLFSTSISFGQSHCMDNQMLIELSDDQQIDRWQLAYPGIDLKIKKKLRTPRKLYLIEWTAEKRNLTALRAQLKNDKSILASQKNCYSDLRITPNDAMYADQWALEKIEVERVWDHNNSGLTSDDDEIVVAVLDSGVDIFHEDLQENLWRNPYEIDNDNIDNDNNGYVDDVLGWNIAQGVDDHETTTHGTAVAGIIGAKGNNEIGVSGIGWNTQLMLFSDLRFMDEAMEALYYVHEQRSRYNDSNGAAGAFVVAVNYSQGYDMLLCDEYPIWDMAFNDLGEVGILCVGATANQDWNIDETGDIPTSCSSDYLITVTNINSTDEKVPGAGYGRTAIDLGAPGSSALTTYPGDSYNSFPGTSSSTPHVAGAIALLYGMPCPNFIAAAKANPAETALAVKNAILNGVDPLPTLRNISVSEGRLNVWNAFLILDEAYGIERNPLSLNLRNNIGTGELLVEASFPEPGDYNFRIIDRTGRNMHGGTISGLCQDAPIPLDLTFLRSGYYFFQLFDDEISISAPFILLDDTK